MNTAAAIELLLAMINSAGPVSEAIRNAHAQGRKMTLDELQAAFDQDDAAKLDLEAAIAQAIP